MFASKCENDARVEILPMATTENNCLVLGLTISFPEDDEDPLNLDWHIADPLSSLSLFDSFVEDDDDFQFILPVATSKDTFVAGASKLGEMCFIDPAQGSVIKDSASLHDPQLSLAVASFSVDSGTDCSADVVQPKMDFNHEFSSSLIVSH